MPTKNPRLNVVLDDTLFAVLSGMAKKEDKSMSIVAKELIQAAIEQHEDLLLSEMALKREEKSKKKISHDKAW
jgi:predicted DNA-binding protein